MLRSDMTRPWHSRDWPVLLFDMAVVALTIGAIDGDAVVATDSSLRIVRLPLSALCGIPCIPGTVLDVSMSIDPSHNKAIQPHAIVGVQQRIRTLLAPALDARALSRAVVLQLAGRSHTGVVLKWPAWPLLAALARGLVSSDVLNSPCGIEADWAAAAPRLHAIDAIAPDRAVSAINPQDTTLRITGLPPNTPLAVRLRFRTAAGVFLTNCVEARTAALTELECLRVAVIVAGHDALDSNHKDADTLSDVLSSLQSLGAVVVTGAINRETTHVVLVGYAEHATSQQKQMLQNCTQLHVPVVSPSWVSACLQSGKMQSVSRFYAPH